MCAHGALQIRVSCKKKTGVPQAPYIPAPLIGHFPVTNEDFFKSVWNCGKNEIPIGIVLMQKWAFLEVIMFNKIFMFYILCFI
jgi:hypothetical protein